MTLSLRLYRCLNAGGELDATNIFNDSSLLVSVITHLGLEHVDTLGHSITEIANAKAGIMKAGTPCVVSQQSFPGAAEALQNEAYARNAIYLAANDFVDVQPTKTALFWAGNSLPESSTSASSQAASPGTPHLRTECSISMGGSLYENIELGIAGAHQCDNAAAALAAFHTMRERCGLPLCTDESVIRDGLANAHLSGRLEAQLVGGCLHVLDGAHTSSAAAALANTLRDLDRRIFLLLAMSSDKDVEGFISELRFLPLDGIVCTEVDVGGSSTRSMSAKRIAQAIRDAKLEVAVEVEHEFRDALSAAQRLAKAGGHHAMVCISGSMHAVAAFHSLIGPSGKLEVTVVRKQWE
jgi:folylpolyglutamate synthase/dihydrofolate synthase